MGKTVVALETELHKAGFDVDLPQAFTLQEIAKTFYGLLPLTLETAVNEAMAVAAQVAAAAVADILASTGVGAVYTSLIAAGGAAGSVIPGLGTVVGIGAALLVHELRLGQPEIKPNERKCNYDPGRLVLTNITKSEPLDLVVYAFKKQIEIDNALAKERSTQYCGRGAAVERAAFWSATAASTLHLLGNMGCNNIQTVGEDCNPDWASDIADSLGLAQINSYIKLYNSLPSVAYSYDTQRWQLVKFDPRKYGQGVELMKLLAAFKRRKAYLDTLVSAQFAVGRSTGLRFQIVTELHHAAVQVVLHPTDTTRAWLATVTELYTKLVQLELAESKANDAIYARNDAAYQAILKDPIKKAALELESLRFRCNDGHAPSCDQLKKLQTEPSPIVLVRNVSVKIPKRSVVRA